VTSVFSFVVRVFIFSANNYYTAHLKLRKFFSWCSIELVGKVPTGKREKMKYVIRRAVASIVLVPAIALAYVVLCAMLIGLGAGASFGIAEAWNNGFTFGIAGAVVFTFFTGKGKLF